MARAARLRGTLRLLGVRDGARRGPARSTGVRDDPSDYLGELDENWIDLVPNTGADLDEPEQTRRLEGRADQVAWQHRAKLFEVTRRLVASIESAAPMR